MLTSLHRWRALLTLCVALAWGLGVLARTPRQGTNEYFNTDTWSLVASDNNTITSLSDLKDGVYSIQLSGVRSGCGLDSKGPEYLGFNNRTCSTKISPSATAGPVMRGPSKSMMWREWMIRVVGGGGEGNSNGDKDVYKTISIQAFIRPDVEDEARCLGFVSTFYGNSDFKGTCVIPPYGSALFLDSSQNYSEDNSEMWKIRLADSSKGEFELIASNKPDNCLRILAVEDCSEQPSLIENSPPYFTKSRKYRSWNLVRRYDLMPNSSPPPPPSPPPSPPRPIGPGPGPLISAPTSTESGQVSVIIQSNGGDGNCLVSSIFLTSIGSAVGSLPETVEVSVSKPGLNSVGVQVPLMRRGYNSIYAVGKCNNGGVTERSNELSVFYTGSSGVSSSPLPGPEPGPEPPLATAFLVSAGNKKIIACDVSGSEMKNCIDSGATGLDAPRDIAISGNTAFVTNLDDNSITTCTISGSELKNCTNIEGIGLDEPTGIAISGNTAYVTNYNDDSVTSCTISGSELKNCTNIEGIGLNYPQAIAFSRGSVLVKNDDIISSCVMVAGNLGNCSDSGATGLSGPQGIAVLGEKAFVANSNDVIISCDISQSQLINCIDSGATELSYPKGIAIFENTAFVTNYANKKVTACTISGSELKNCTDSGATGLDNPQIGIAIFNGA